MDTALPQPKFSPSPVCPEHVGRTFTWYFKTEDLLTDSILEALLPRIVPCSCLNPLLPNDYINTNSFFQLITVQ